MLGESTESNFLKNYPTINLLSSFFAGVSAPKYGKIFMESLSKENSRLIEHIFKAQKQIHLNLQKIYLKQRKKNRSKSIKYDIFKKTEKNKKKFNDIESI